MSSRSNQRLQYHKPGLKPISYNMTNQNLLKRLVIKLGKKKRKECIKRDQNVTRVNVTWREN